MTTLSKDRILRTLALYENDSHWTLQILFFYESHTGIRFLTNRNLYFVNLMTHPKYKIPKVGPCCVHSCTHCTYRALSTQQILPKHTSVNKWTESQDRHGSPISHNPCHEHSTHCPKWKSIMKITEIYSMTAILALFQSDISAVFQT